MIDILIDNRLRLPLAALSPMVLEELREAFTHENPKHKELVALGFRYNKEPKFYELWRDEDNCLSLPRGGMQKVREIFDAHDLDFGVQDCRCDGLPSQVGSYVDGWELGPDLFPVHKLVAWDHQTGMVEAIKKREQILVRAPTGCITGDAMIGINRGGKGSQVRLDHIVKMHNGGTRGNRHWDSDIQTRVRARMNDGTVRLVNLVDAYVSGEKRTYQLDLASGHAVSATLDHRFMTTEGWKRLGELTIGDEVYVEEARRPKKRGTSKKPWYKLRVVKNHPFAARRGIKPGKGGHTVALHRLVVEAQLNNLSLDGFIAMCNASLYQIGGMTFLDPKKWVVHHIDEDPHNNDLDNLAVVTQAQHNTIHADLALNNIAVRTVPSEVVSISNVGVRETYDLVLEEPHNFLANGIVVHNSGKTSALLKAIAEIQVPALVIMWDSGLLKQWQERIEEELGIAKKDQGVIRAQTFRLKPITLAMQQTLAKWDDTKWERLSGIFGMVACDEVQRYAAKTFLAQIDRFDCKYRVGVSADERRKDKKTFLIYDMFGEVKHEVSKKELVAKRIIHEVECYVVPTNFRCDWYVEKRNANALELTDHTKLKTDMQNDEERNELAVRMIEECIRAGLPTLAFTQFVDHARKLDAALTKRGIASGLALGGPDWEDTFNETVQGLRDGKLQAGCGTFGKLGVGHDIPTVAAGIAVTPVHNNRPFLGQVKGRICRTTAGKQNARILILWDRLVFGHQPLFNLKAWNEVCRVWDEWEGRWKDIGDYMKESMYGKRTGTTESAAETEDIFKYIQDKRSGKQAE